MPLDLSELSFPIYSAVPYGSDEAYLCTYERSNSDGFEDDIPFNAAFGEHDVWERRIFFRDNAPFLVEVESEDSFVTYGVAEDGEYCGRFHSYRKKDGKLELCIRAEIDGDEFHGLFEKFYNGQEKPYFTVTYDHNVAHGESVVRNHETGELISIGFYENGDEISMKKPDPVTGKLVETHKPK